MKRAYSNHEMSERSRRVPRKDTGSYRSIFNLRERIDSLRAHLKRLQAGLDRAATLPRGPAVACQITNYHHQIADTEVEIRRLATFLKRAEEKHGDRKVGVCEDFYSDLP